LGQKVHPYGFRLGYIKPWKSRWYANKGEFADLLLQDIKIRRFVKSRLSNAAVSRVELERASDRMRVFIFTARPGVIIGRRGAEIDKLREELQNMTGIQVFIDIKEIKTPATDAQLIAENIAFQLEKRIAFRRAMKRAVQMAMQQGAGGIKIICSGRLGGNEIARSESYKEGKIPLQTIRADIDYGFAQAFTSYGTIGIKIWVYKGDIIKGKKEKKDATVSEKS
jgi:small subunit ribosomal protein S3